MSTFKVSFLSFLVIVSFHISGRMAQIKQAVPYVGFHAIGTLFLIWLVVYCLKRGDNK